MDDYVIQNKDGTPFCILTPERYTSILETMNTKIPNKDSGSVYNIVFEGKDIVLEYTKEEFDKNRLTSAQISKNTERYKDMVEYLEVFPKEGLTLVKLTFISTAGHNGVQLMYLTKKDRKTSMNYITGDSSLMIPDDFLYDLQHIPYRN